MSNGEREPMFDHGHRERLFTWHGKCLRGVQADAKSCDKIENGEGRVSNPPNWREGCVQGGMTRMRKILG